MIPLGVLASRRPAAGGGGLDLIAGDYTGSSDTSVTTSSVDIGAASSSRVVVIALASTGSLNRECTAMTIGGVTATRDASGGSARAGAHIFRAAVPSGTTASVVTTWSGTGHSFAFQVYAAQAGTSLIDTEWDQSDSARDTLTVTPDSASGGTVLAVASAGSGHVVSSVSFATVDRTSNSSIIGRSAGTGSPVTLTATFAPPPVAAYGRLVSASYA